MTFRKERVLDGVTECVQMRRTSVIRATCNRSVYHERFSPVKRKRAGDDSSFRAARAAGMQHVVGSPWHVVRGKEEPEAPIASCHRHRAGRLACRLSHDFVWLWLTFLTCFRQQATGPRPTPAIRSGRRRRTPNIGLPINERFRDPYAPQPTSDGLSPSPAGCGKGSWQLVVSCLGVPSCYRLQATSGRGRMRRNGHPA